MDLKVYKSKKDKFYKDLFIAKKEKDIANIILQSIKFAQQAYEEGIISRDEFAYDLVGFGLELMSVSKKMSEDYDRLIFDYASDLEVQTNAKFLTDEIASEYEKKTLEGIKTFIKKYEPLC